MGTVSRVHSATGALTPHAARRAISASRAAAQLPAARSQPTGENADDQPGDQPLDLPADLPGSAEPDLLDLIEFVIRFVFHHLGIPPGLLVLGFLVWQIGLVVAGFVHGLLRPDDFCLDHPSRSRELEFDQPGQTVTEADLHRAFQFRILQG